MRKRSEHIGRQASETRGRRQEITEAATALIVEKGYEAATLRGIARKVGLKVGSLYNHLNSKQDLLFDIMHGAMEELLLEVEAATRDRPDPVERMRAAVECHIVFDAMRVREVFIGNSEIRSLTPANRAKVVDLRRRYTRLFQKAIEDGMREGVFRVDDAAIASHAILDMCTGVANWYSQRGRLSVQELARIYGRMALRTLSVRENSDVPTTDVDATPVGAGQSHSDGGDAA